MSSIVLVASSFFRCAPRAERFVFAVLVASGAFVLYPMALGVGLYDPYRLGFESWGFLAVLFALSCALWHRALYLPLVCILAAVMGQTLGLLESENLWDYLFDPWLVGYTIYEFRALRRKT